MFRRERGTGRTVGAVVGGYDDGIFIGGEGGAVVGVLAGVSKLQCSAVNPEYDRVSADGWRA